MRHSPRHLFSAALVACALLATGCVMTPDRGTELRSSQQPILFTGMSAYPNETIEIEAYNKHTRTWDLVATTTSGTHPFDYNGTKLYPYSKTFKFADLEVPSPQVPGACYVSDSCYVVWYRTEVRFRVHEKDRQLGHYTFDPGGVHCVTDLQPSGIHVMDAYDQCKPTFDDEHPLTELHMIKPQGVVNENF